MIKLRKDDETLTENLIGTKLLVKSVDVEDKVTRMSWD